MRGQTIFDLPTWSLRTTTCCRGRWQDAQIGKVRKGTFRIELNLQFRAADLLHRGRSEDFGKMIIALREITCVMSTRHIAAIFSSFHNQDCHARFLRSGILPGRALSRPGRDHLRRRVRSEDGKQRIDVEAISKLCMSNVVGEWE